MDKEIKTSPGAKKQKPKVVQVAGETRLYVDLVVKDREGNVVEQRSFPSRSFLRQFIDILYAHMTANRLGYNVRKTDNTLQSVIKHDTDRPLNVLAGSGVTTFGLVVGTGTTAPAIDDYRLEALIAHGSAGGQLLYSAHVHAAPTDDGTVSRFQITRDFSNNSGATITVTELGVFSENVWGAGAFAVIRDVTDPGIDIAHGQTLTINYRVQGSTVDGILKNWINVVYAMFVTLSRPFINTDGATVTYSIHRHGIEWIGGQALALTTLVAPAWGECTRINFHPTNRAVHRDRNGVQVGTGDAAVTVNDFGLAGRISEGDGAGELIFEKAHVAVPVVAGGVASLPFYRYFKNQSGASIEIKEIGLYVQMGAAPPGAHACLYRTVLPVPVTLNDGELLLAEHLLQVVA